MKKMTEFYLSSILNHDVYDELNDCIGKLMDIYVTTDYGSPRAIGYKIKNGREIENFEFKSVDVYEEKGKTIIRVNEVKDIIPRKYSYLLSKNLLDKDIVDVDGKKIVRVEDLKLVKRNGYVIVAAVEAGPLAKARKAGFEKGMSRILKLFNKSLEGTEISWESVESLEMFESSLKLTMPYNKLSRLHPVDIANIIEDLSPEDRVKVIDGLSTQLASDTLEELESEVSQEILRDISEDKAKSILDVMPNDEIANILEEMDEETANKVLVNLDDDDETEILDLMKYEEESVGNIMNTDFVSFNIDITVEETINILRELDVEEEILSRIYITSDEGKIKGIVSLRDLLISEGSKRLKGIMQESYFTVNDTDSIEKAMATALKYDLYSVPVIDEEKKICGVATITDMIDEILPPHWKRRLKRIN